MPADRSRRGPLVLAALALLAACGDRAGVRHAGPPARVVSLAPSITEIVYALDEGARLVGVCAQCDYPVAVRDVPRVGGYLAPSVEAVVAARPDLVVAVPSPENREAVRAIERVGIRVLVVRDRTLDDLWASVRAIAAALGVPDRGERLVAAVQGRLDAVRARLASLPARPTLLVVGHSPLVVAGGGTLQDTLLTIAGGRNVAADVGQAFPHVSAELVVARAPEVIVDAAMGTEQGSQALFAALTTVPAVRDGRIVTVAPDALFRSGPRVGEAAEALARAIHPEAFPG